jgi:23S rRNA (cytosine1962-C5)-methyltransferase
MKPPTGLRLLWPTEWADYELLDSGNGARLERFGQHTVLRPEPHALWQPGLPERQWNKADARFERFRDLPEGQGQWLKERDFEEPWVMRYGDLRFHVRLTPFKHLGVFPEQAANWEWCADLIRQRRGEVRVLNLFGYTGLATLSAAQAGARVTHVDASKPTMAWARKNQELSRLQDKPIRWLLDDAVKFVKREARREGRYEGLILDPPAFGRGPKGEIWRFSDSLPELLQDLTKLLSDQPLFVLVNAYAVSDSATVLSNLLDDMLGRLGGELEAGELALQEHSKGRLLSTSIFARWCQRG